MEVIKRLIGKDIIVAEEDEIDLIKWDEVNRGCFYLDIWGKIHFEINNKGYNLKPWNSNLYHYVFQHDKLYESLPTNLLKASCAKSHKDLIGARQFVYSRKNRIILPIGVGILSWPYMQGRGDLLKNPDVGNIRRNAFATLFKVLDKVAIKLGAKFGYFSTKVIPEEKMKQFGCVLVKSSSLKHRLLHWMGTFPMGNIPVYLKFYDSEDEKST